VTNKRLPGDVSVTAMKVSPKLFIHRFVTVTAQLGNHDGTKRLGSFPDLLFIAGYRNVTRQSFVCHRFLKNEVPIRRKRASRTLTILDQNDHEKSTRSLFAVAVAVAAQSQITQPALSARQILPSSSAEPQTRISP